MTRIDQEKWWSGEVIRGEPIGILMRTGAPFAENVTLYKFPTREEKQIDLSNILADKNKEISELRSIVDGAKNILNNNH